MCKDTHQTMLLTTKIFAKIKILIIRQMANRAQKWTCAYIINEYFDKGEPGILKEKRQSLWVSPVVRKLEIRLQEKWTWTLSDTTHKTQRNK